MTNDARPLIRVTPQTDYWSDCFGCGRCYARLDPEQERILAELGEKSRMGLKYDEAKLNEMLLVYYGSLFPSNPVPSLPGPEWKTMGFQSEFPARDLRAGGFAVECMIYLSRHYAEQTRDMILESQEKYYPFSTTCINIVQLLVVFFRLQTKGTISPLGCDAPHSNFEEIKAFARMCVAESSEKAFNELFCACVIRCHHEWLEVANRGGNLLNFRSCLESTLNALQEGLSDATTIDEITAYMRLV